MHVQTEERSEEFVLMQESLCKAQRAEHAPAEKVTAGRCPEVVMKHIMWSAHQGLGRFFSLLVIAHLPCLSTCLPSERVLLAAVLLGGEAKHYHIGTGPALGTEGAISMRQEGIIGIHKLHILSLCHHQSLIAGGREPCIGLTHIPDVSIHLLQHGLW